MRQIAAGTRTSAGVQQEAAQRVSAHRGKNHLQTRQAPSGVAPTATDAGYPRLGSRPATLTRGRKQ